jgi:hypothetical protein
MALPQSDSPKYWMHRVQPAFQNPLVPIVVDANQVHKQNYRQYRRVT